MYWYSDICILTKAVFARQAKLRPVFTRSIVALDTDQLPKLVAVFEKVKGEGEILMRRKAGYK